MKKTTYYTIVKEWHREVDDEMYDSLDLETFEDLDEAEEKATYLNEYEAKRTEIAANRYIYTCFSINVETYLGSSIFGCDTIEADSLGFYHN